MTIRSTVKRLTAATFAIAALTTVVGATSAQAAEMGSPAARKAVATITIPATTPYANAFNACVKAEAVVKSKALTKKSTRAKALKVITAKCTKVANAAIAPTASTVPAAATSPASTVNTVNTVAVPAGAPAVVSTFNATQVAYYVAWTERGTSPVEAADLAGRYANPATFEPEPDRFDPTEAFDPSGRPAKACS